MKGSGDQGRMLDKKKVRSNQYSVISNQFLYSTLGTYYLFSKRHSVMPQESTVIANPAKAE